MCCKQYAALSLVLVLVAQSAIAQLDAPGKPVSIPGVEIPGLGQSGEVRGTFGLPPGAKSKVTVVLILHGSGGVDGRGAFYATALQKAGIATLEITMFLRNVYPREGTRATMPHAAAALRWLATQPEVDPKRIGLMGFSWGGGHVCANVQRVGTREAGERLAVANSLCTYLSHVHADCPGSKCAECEGAPALRLLEPDECKSKVDLRWNARRL